MSKFATKNKTTENRLVNTWRGTACLQYFSKCSEVWRSTIMYFLCRLHHDYTFHTSPSLQMSYLRSFHWDCVFWHVEDFVTDFGNIHRQVLQVVGVGAANLKLCHIHNFMNYLLLQSIEGTRQNKTCLLYRKKQWLNTVPCSHPFVRWRFWGIYMTQ